MPKITTRALAVLAALGLLSCSAPRVASGLAPDTILHNGKIITVDEQDRVAQALAIRDGRILAVGSSQEILELAGAGTERIDLQGLAATPGLLDAHCHFANGSVSRLYVLDLSYPGVQSIDDVVRKVAEAVADLPSGDWVRGRGWDEGKLAELRYIYAEDLDRVSPEHPVWLTHTMGHYGVANSLALEIAGVTPQTPDPPGGTIDRDAQGRPTGVLKESAQSLVRRHVPRATQQQRREGIRSLAAEFNKEGMTGLKDPGIGPEQWADYQSVLAEGALTVRVFALWRAGNTLESAGELIERIGPFTRPHVSTGDDRLISGGVKLHIDGSGGARTAWLYDEWNKNRTEVDRGNRGYPVIEPETLRQQIDLFHRAGLHVSVHSIGDRGIDWVVDSFAMSLQQHPISGLRHGIIHANIPSDHALEVMAGLQKDYDAGYPEPSATFMWWIGDTYAGNFGVQRSSRLNPFRTFLARGIRWAGGSDFGVTPFPARYGLWASVAREALLGVHGSHPFGTEESIDVRQALRSFTIWSARQMFLEDEIGTLEPGKYADIAVWDRDLYSIPSDQLKDLRCYLTLFQGKAVYQASDSPLSRVAGATAR